MTEVNPKEETTMNMENRTMGEADKAPGSMEEIRKGIEAAIDEKAKAPALSELARFMATVEKQREMVRKRSLDRESNYQLHRGAVVNDFWLRFQHLQHELEDTLRTMDLAHEKQVDDDRKLFTALDSARG